MQHLAVRVVAEAHVARRQVIARRHGAGRDAIVRDLLHADDPGQ